MFFKEVFNLELPFEEVLKKEFRRYSIRNLKRSFGKRVSKNKVAKKRQMESIFYYDFFRIQEKEVFNLELPCEEVFKKEFRKKFDSLGYLNEYISG